MWEVPGNHREYLGNILMAKDRLALKETIHSP